tara:strand:+ start:1497 stop:1712 length:216 start_codon:yes stop_codon:yes gene_type:complete
MDSSDESVLNNKEVLLFLLGMMVKRDGGMVTIPEKDIMEHGGAEMLTLAYDKRTASIILMIVDTSLPATSN